MRYLIKEVSELVGISPTTIRYYEKIGIIHVEKDEKTGYRYFSPIDINILMRLRILREQGFTMEEIEKLFCAENVDGTVDLYRKKEELLEQDIRKLQEQKAAIKREELLMRERDDKYVIRPRMYGVLYRNNDNIFKDRMLRETIAEWMHHAFYTLPLFEVEVSSVGETRFSMGICMDAEDARSFGLDKNPYVFCIEEKPCVRKLSTICVEPDESSGMTMKMLDEYKKRGIVVTGKIYGRTLHSYRERGKLIVVNEQWFPVV